MIPVEQTMVWSPESPDGNCFDACIASILECPIEEVPHYTDPKWLQKYWYWLQDRGWDLDYQLFREGEAPPEGYAILAVKSPRGPIEHAVVIKDGEIVWDPHPERALGVGAWVDYCILRPKQPSTSL